MSFSCVHHSTHDPACPSCKLARMFGNWNVSPPKRDPESIRRANRVKLATLDTPEWIKRTRWNGATKKYETLEKRWSAALSKLLNACNERPEPVELTDEMIGKAEEEVRLA